MGNVKLRVLNPAQYEFLSSKDPKGFYDRGTREKLYLVIQKLEKFRRDCTRPENQLLKTFLGAEFGILIPKGVESNGLLTSRVSVRVEGKHEGELNIQGNLFVSEEGCVLGPVTTRAVSCRGKIVGDVTASNKIILHATGMLIGNVVATGLQAETGAMFKGKCRFAPSQEAEPEPVRKKAVGQFFSSVFSSLG